MPTYEYACSKCGHQFELFQPIADKPLSVCAKNLCKLKPWGKGKVKRVIGAGAGIIFKGSGFYATDYRSAGYKEAAKKDSATPAASSTDSKTGAGKSESPKKSESKPAKSSGD
jgi:putative FmdB family regulatory protein